MPHFRKKTTVIEAVQWWPDIDHPGVKREDATGAAYVVTLHEQRAYLKPGDWIISEPKPGRYYPCKPDIFAATYDPA